MRSFEIQYTQYLNEAGEVVENLPEFARDAANLVPQYRAMVSTRLFDKKSVILQRTGKIGTYPSSLGQEATAIAIGSAMLADDVLFPTYREHGIYLSRGVTMTELLLYWGGDERGMDFKHVREDFPVCIPIATQVTHAAGVAFAFKYRNQPRVAVPVCGDGATSKGDFYEAMNVAGIWNLPCVFVVTNNEWAISVPRSKQTACETMAQKAIAAGFHGEQVDGNDVIAVYDRFNAALNKARNGEGPTLIETLTYRMGDHTTADDAGRYRSDEEVQERERLDPVLRLKTFLINQGAWSEQEEQKLIEETEAKIEHAIQEYLDIPPMPPESMFDCLYETLPKAYRNQLEASVHEQESND